MADFPTVAATPQQLLNQTTPTLLHVVPDEIQVLETLPIPINLLPPELLRMVFGHLRRPPFLRCPGYLGPPMGFASYKPLVNAMLVCHKWYAIASQAASLWTDIDFQRQRTFAPMLLRRSLGADIHLCGQLTSEDDALGTAIRNNGTRLRELDLCPGKSVPALQSILAVDMPRLRVLCLSREGTSAAQALTVLTGVPVSFPSLKAMLLASFLLVPAHVLPKLTHLHLAKMEQVDASNILDVLRNTPALEVFDITSSDFIIPLPVNSTTVPLPVALPRLQSSCISQSTSAAVSYLMTALDVPALAFLEISRINACEGIHLSTPLLPDVLATHTMRRLSFSIPSAFDSFCTTFHGKGVSLAMELYVGAVPEIERAHWVSTDFPTMLSLSGIEEFHIQAREWEGVAHQDLLPHLAAHMPAVSTLVIRHDRIHDMKDVDRHMGLAQTVARVLESDSPVLFPQLAHLELIIGTVPMLFLELIARALARRDERGRRLRTLRIRFGDHCWSYWNMRALNDRTGIFDHVDCCLISDSRNFFFNDEDTERLGWGRWKDCVHRARHGYWRE